MTDRGSRHEWPGASLARVPYWVYQDEDNYRAELRRIFEGPVWNYVCLESDLAAAGRLPDDASSARCRSSSVRGARRRDPRLREPLRPPRRADRAGRQRAPASTSSASTTRGATTSRGNLVGIAFEKGANGQGGMPASFCKAEHGPRQLRTDHAGRARLRDACPPDTPPIEDYLGAEVLGARSCACCARPRRGAGPLHPGPAEQLEALRGEREGHVPREPAPHLLRHVPHHAPHPGRRRAREPRRRAITPATPSTARTTGRAPPIAIRASAPSSQSYRLADPSLLDAVDEFGDDIQLQILTVFPNLVLQQIHNSLAVRQVLPQGPGRDGAALDLSRLRRRRRPTCAAAASSSRTWSGPRATSRWRTAAWAASCSAGSRRRATRLSVVNMGGEGAESQETRATEASVRGFWKAYRRYMGD